MQPLIKWPGGKSSEYEIIRKFIPKYERYVEPFFGGGAVFFNMPQQTAVINDISVNLMQFYSYVQKQDAKFKGCLYAIDDEWNLLKKLAEQEISILLPKFKEYRQTEEKSEGLLLDIYTCCDSVCATIAECSEIVINAEILQREIRRTVTEKFFRMHKNEQSSGPLVEKDIISNLLTGFTSGYYMYLRDVLNSLERHMGMFISDEYKIAIFYFVREFCYGSMFRYNRSGDFNIPYGGIAYNTKDFRKKIDTLFCKETEMYFAKTELHCSDFETILDNVGSNDFLFLDPPYDTDFSDYENRCFGASDQRRLAARLHDTPAKFLLIIKNTPLISELYQNNGYRVYAFDNQYSYCVKGRNDRNAVHLIITNYD